jgi:protein gp37
MMSGTSAIEWTEATWNPVTGCDRISPGCDHCYAMTLAARLKRMGQPGYQNDGDPRTSGPGFGLTLHPDRLAAPTRTRKPTMWFVNSMSDLFHKDVPDEFISRVWGVMADNPRHTFQVLTKRPKRARNVLTRYGWATPHGQPLSNVWLGTSIESSKYAWRADHLRLAPAAVRFISAEPLLGPLVNLSPRAPISRQLDLDGIDWLIVGGESGRGYRPMEASWARDLRDACAEAGTAFFFKQWGGIRPKSGGRDLDGRTWDEMPTTRWAA